MTRIDVQTMISEAIQAERARIAKIIRREAYLSPEPQRRVLSEIADAIQPVYAVVPQHKGSTEG